MMQSSTAAAMYSTAQQQLACLMELRQYQQQQQQQPFLRRPEAATSPLYYGGCSSLQQSQRPPSKAFTIDAILGLHAAADSGRSQPKKSAGLVASLAAACRRSAVQAALCSQQQLQQQQPQEGKLAGPESCGAGKAGLKQQQGHSGHQPGSSKSKRVRTIFTPEQLERLEAEFERQQYMVGPERLYLASALHLTEAQVKVWFQNRRIKWRKQHLELQQQRLAVLKQQQQCNGAAGLGQLLGGAGDDESMSEASSASETPD